MGPRVWDGDLCSLTKSGLYSDWQSLSFGAWQSSCRSCWAKLDHCNCRLSPWSNCSKPEFNKLQALCSRQLYEITHSVKGDDNTTSSFLPLEQQENPAISMTICWVSTNWMITDEFATPAQIANVGSATLLFWLVQIPGTDSGFGERCLHFRGVTQDFKQLLKTILSFCRLLFLTSTPSFCRYGFLRFISIAKRFFRIDSFLYLDGEEFSSKTARSFLPNARIINAYGPTEATVALSAVAVKQMKC